MEDDRLDGRGRWRGNRAQRTDEPSVCVCVEDSLIYRLERWMDKMTRCGEKGLCISWTHPLSLKSSTDA